MTLAAMHEALRHHALCLPEAWEDHPWGERVAKVKKKVFVFSGYHADEDRFSLSLKLPLSREAALQVPGAAPTGYGLGKAGWVSLGFRAGEDVPLDTLMEWIEESYRAVAPKGLAARLDRG